MRIENLLEHAWEMTAVSIMSASKVIFAQHCYKNLLKRLKLVVDVPSNPLYFC